MKRVLKNVMAIVAISLSFACSSISAQEMIKTNINGVYFAKGYTKTQIEALWGAPSTYRAQAAEAGYGQEYGYGKDRFYFLQGDQDANYFLVDFDIYTNKFKINGTVGVGDDVSKIEQLPNPKKIVQDGRDVVYIYSVSATTPFVSSIGIYSKNNIIYRLMYTNIY